MGSNENPMLHEGWFGPHAFIVRTAFSKGLMHTNVTTSGTNDTIKQSSIIVVYNNV